MITVVWHIARDYYTISGRMCPTPGFLLFGGSDTVLCLQPPTASLPQASEVVTTFRNGG